MQVDGGLIVTAILAVVIFIGTGMVKAVTPVVMHIQFQLS